MSIFKFWQMVGWRNTMYFLTRVPLHASCPYLINDHNYVKEYYIKEIIYSTSKEESLVKWTNWLP